MTLDQETLTAHFGRIWPVHMDAFCDRLVVLRRHFGGDLDRMMVLARCRPGRANAKAGSPR